MLSKPKVLAIKFTMFSPNIDCVYREMIKEEIPKGESVRNALGMHGFFVLKIIPGCNRT